ATPEDLSNEGVIRRSGPAGLPIIDALASCAAGRVLEHGGAGVFPAGPASGFSSRLCHEPPAGHSPLHFEPAAEDSTGAGTRLADAGADVRGFGDRLLH